MTFATTSANRLNIQAPELSKFVIAFKDLSDELPENTGVNVGMFILDIAGKYIYIPALAKAGNVQVLESMFDSDSKTFIPITKKSVKWMIDKGHLLGKADRIPSHVAKDPDLYDAIVPPKTGKFVYASEGRIGGFFASMPELVKQAALRIIDEDYDLQQALVKVMDIDIAREHLIRETPKYVAPTGPEAPKVVTSTDGLSDVQIQEILSKGYTVVNPPASTNVVVESSTSGYGALTSMGAPVPGSAVMVVKKDGTWVGAASLKMVPRPTNDSLDPLKKCVAPTNSVMITENGEIISNPKAVISAKEISYDDVITRLDYRKATDINNGDKGFIFTGAAFLGPLTVRQVVKANGWTNLETSKGSIKIHPNVRTFYDVQGSTTILSDAAVFYPTSGECEVETDINLGEYKMSLDMAKLLPYTANLMHRNGVYAVDGKEIGGKPQIVEHLMNEWAIDVPTIETFMKKSEQQEKVIVKMAAVREGGRASPGTGTKVQPIYSHGGQPGSDDIQMSGNARQRAQFMASKAKSIKELGDREVMEATIISELLQNPDMSGQIREYLPEISQAVDRLGRSLFLMRINTDKLSDKVDAEALNRLFTQTRNAYRILGENYVELQNLVATEV